MDKLEMVKAGVVALVRYTGSLQGYTHKNPMTGNSHVFAGPNVFAKVYDLKDVEFYESKKSFEVEMLVVEVDDLVVVEDDVVLEAPELVKEEPEEDKDEADGEDKDEAKDIEPVKKEEPKEKPSQSKPKDKPKNKPKGKGGVK